MQTAKYNILYAQSIPELQGNAAVVAGDAAGVLDLVTADEYSFASGVWFFATQCSEAVKEGVVNNGQAGWENYLTGCVGVTDTSDRIKGWEAAKKAFGL